MVYSWQGLLWGAAESGKAMKPINSLVWLGDSISYQVGSSNLLTASGDGKSLTGVASSAWRNGSYVDVRGAYPSNFNGYGRIIDGGGADEQICVEMENEISGSAGAIDQWGMKLQYGIATPGGFFGHAAALSGVHPYISHYGAQGSLNTEELVGRVHTEVLPFQPSHAAFICGTNDIKFAELSGLSDAEIVENLKTCCTICTEKGIQVLLFSITPSAESYGFRQAERRLNINRLLRSWAETETDVFYVDVHTPMSNSYGYAFEGYLIDSVHPSEAGYYAGSIALVEIFRAYGVEYYSVGINRIENSSFASVTSGNGISGEYPAGCGIYPVNSSIEVSSSVEDGIWTVNATGGSPADSITMFLMPQEHAALQDHPNMQIGKVEVWLEDGADVRVCLLSDYYLNSDAGLTTANRGVDWTIPVKETWLKLQSRPLKIFEGDAYGANRWRIVAYFPENGEIKLKLRKPAAITLPS